MGTPEWSPPPDQSINQKPNLSPLRGSLFSLLPMQILQLLTHLLLGWTQYLSNNKTKSCMKHTTITQTVIPRCLTWILVTTRTTHFPNPLYIYQGWTPSKQELGIYTKPLM